MTFIKIVLYLHLLLTIKKMIKIETRAFERVNKVHPNSMMGISHVWMDGKGWMSIDQVYEFIGKPKVLSLRSLLRRIKKHGFSKVNLEIEANRKPTVYSDFTINELVRA